MSVCHDFTFKISQKATLRLLCNLELTQVIYASVFEKEYKLFVDELMISDYVSNEYTPSPAAAPRFPDPGLR